MLTLHLEHAGKSTRIGAFALPAANPRPRPTLVTSAGEVTSVRLITGVRAQPPGIDFAALRDGDPELDLSRAGMAIDRDSASLAYVDPENPDAGPVGDFAEVEIVCDASGNEKERRPRRLRRANLDEVQPLKLGRRLPRREVEQRFVIRRVLQLGHVDGLTFAFLHELAAELAAGEQAATLGAGAKGNQPLVLRDGGSPYRAFLVGAVDGERYQLLLLLSDQELKRPEAGA